MGGFTAGKSEIDVEDGKLRISKDGQGKKFIKNVQQITFSADYARETGQEVTYVTERAVFKLVEDGIELVKLHRVLIWKKIFLLIWNLHQRFPKI